ncbi:hypothetical protein TL16_g04494 [Triparma laevis f. inornata]|uniref:DNA repair protein REV1 n=1 Tax=Triparma laevis f. inornata TaxID=1714386 RepID=A0A9W7A6A8_9STRA|nr:hypothetical protein TL16_g04494 [Triparma laevis f. inornata]
MALHSKSSTNQKPILPIPITSPSEAPRPISRQERQQKSHTKPHNNSKGRPSAYSGPNLSKANATTTGNDPSYNNSYDKYFSKKITKIDQQRAPLPLAQLISKKNMAQLIANPISVKSRDEMNQIRVHLEMKLKKGIEQRKPLATNVREAAPKPPPSPPKDSSSDFGIMDVLHNLQKTQSTQSPLKHTPPSPKLPPLPPLLNPLIPRNKSLFKGIRVMCDSCASPPNTFYENLLHQNGGSFEPWSTNYTGKVTHVICGMEAVSEALAKIIKKQRDPKPYLKPSWIIDCYRMQRILSVGEYLIDCVRGVEGQRSVEQFGFGMVEKGGVVFPVKKVKMTLLQTKEPQQNTTTKTTTKTSKSNQPRTTATDPTYLKIFFSSSRLAFIGRHTDHTTLQPSKPSIAHSKNKKYIVHVDMDAFFVTVVTRFRPDLKGKPIAVTWGSGGGNGELSTCNYEAREKGVRKGMWLKRG